MGHAKAERLEVNTFTLRHPVVFVTAKDVGPDKFAYGINRECFWYGV